MQTQLSDEFKFVHSLSGPLMIALLHCQALSSSSSTTPPEIRQRLEKIEKALGDMKTLVENRRISLSPSREP
jgi:hypothetical protein